MVGEQHTIVLNEIEQIGHLLEVGRHIGIVAAQMHIVELDMHDVFNPAIGSL